MDELEMQGNAGEQTVESGVNQEGNTGDVPLSGEGNEPANPEANETDNEDTFRAEVEKRGYRNVIEENRRKSDELKKLKDEYESFKKNQQRPQEQQQARQQQTQQNMSRIEMAMQTDWGKEMVEEGRALGLSDKFIEAQLKASEAMSGNATQPFMKRFQEQDLKDALKAFGSEDKNKVVMSKYAAEIEAKVREYAPQYWNDPQLIKAVAGQVAIEHFQDWVGTSKPKLQDSPTETAKPVSSAGISGISNDVKEYAERFNLDLSKPGVKEAAIKGALMMKKAMEKLD